MPRRNGAPYRRIVVTYWNDPDVKRVLSLEEKGFLAYLFSNEHSHPCGVYRLTPIHVLDELGVSAERMRELFDGPMAPFATYDWRTEEVFVTNMAEHQIDGGLFGKDKRIGWVVTQLHTIHSEQLIASFKNRYSDWSIPWGKVLDEPDQKPHNHAEKEGASDGAYQGPSHAPYKGEELPRKSGPSRKGHRKGHTKGHTKGHGKPDPVPDPVTVPEAINHPPPSGNSLGPAQQATAREDAEPALDPLVRAALPLARANIVAIHGATEDPVTIEGHQVGIGVEINAFKAICRTATDPPDVIARAIAFLPEVSNLATPVSLARWGAEDGGAVYERCVALAYKQASGNGVHTSAVARPMPEKPSTSEAQQEARRKLAQLRAAEAR